MLDVEQTPLITEIVIAVANESGIPIAAILGRSHEHPITNARHAVWRRVRADLGLSYPAIGKRFGVHHSTVISALNGRRASTVELAMKSGTGAT